MSNVEGSGQRPAPVTFREALRYWLKLGCISFGGPAGQISIMHQELVEKRRWISESRFLHALNYTMMLPGPEAQQLATYIGWLLHGIRGGIAAGALFVLPSLIITYQSELDLPVLRRRAGSGGRAVRHQTGGDGHRSCSSWSAARQSRRPSMTSATPAR